MKIRPLFDRIVVRQILEETKTKSGLVLAESATEKPTMAEIIAVGEGKTSKDAEKMVVKKGDKIIFSKYAGVDFKVDGETITIIKLVDILGIIE